MKRIWIFILVVAIFDFGYGEGFSSLAIKEIEAQNFIGGKDIFMYWGGNLVDGDISTSWAYTRGGTDKLFYTRAIVSFHFRNTNWIDEIRIWNGYGKNTDLWKKNNRAKEISIWLGISVTNDFMNKKYILKDTEGYQSIKFNPVLVNKVNIQILSTYPGTTYDDTCISEIEFWYQGQKYEVANLEDAKREFVKKRKRERVRDVLMSGIYVVEWRGSKEDSIYGYLTPEGEMIETRDRNYWIHDVVYRTMIVKKTNRYGWRNDVWGCELEWEIREDGLYYRVSEGDMKKRVNELKKQGYGVFSYPDEIKKQIKKGWLKIEKGKVVGKWKIDVYGNLLMDMGKGWKIYNNVLSGLMSRYGESVEIVPTEGQTAEFKANNVGSELFIGNERQGVEVYTLFYLWEKGKLKLPVE
ncbi:MAG: NADase-type glycan-binding domain-containing protein [Brevinematia bacterium]